MVQAFNDAVEGFRVSVGPMRVLQYTLQGLFHPTRKVREVYWKVYNTLYIGSQDALVMAFPKIGNDNRNHYTRSELEITL